MECKPNIYSYTHPLTFIKDTFKYLKHRNADYTVRWWSKEMGFSSPKVLIEILENRRKIKLKYVPFLSKGLVFDDSERLYFETLIFLSQTEIPEEKSLLKILLSQLRPKTEVNVERATDDEIFSHWTHSAILSLARQTNFKLSEDFALSSLRYEVSRETIKESFDTLKKLGYLLEEAENHKKSKEFVSTTTDRPHNGGKKYVRQINDLANKALELQQEERELQCFSLSIKHSDLKIYKDLVRNFRAQLVSLGALEGDCIYQVNLQLFPLTHILKSEESRSNDSVKELQFATMPTS